MLGIALILTIFLGAAYLYQFAGLKYYVGTANMISKISEPERTQEKINFYGDKNDTKGYNGILARVNKVGLGGIWVWGRFGLLYLPAEKESKFFFVDVCSTYYTTGFVSNGSDNTTEVPYYQPESSFNVQQWGEKAKVGNFVEVLSKTDVGFLKGNLGAVFAYNGRYPLTDLKTICE